MADGAVKVAVRVRPPFPQEQNQCVEGSIEVLPEQAQLVVAQEYGFTFDYTFDTTATQEDVYTRCVADLIGKVTTGYNCSVLMYGQTGSGKTYTMGTNYGQSEVAAANPGIIPQAVRDLFAVLSQQQGCWTAKVSLLEIYNENVFDLLANPKEREAIPIREVGKVIVLPGLVNQQVGGPEEALQCLEQGSRNRSTGATLLNSCSSRSHAIFSIHLQGHVQGTMFTSKLQLVDLAGSEAVKRTHSTGDRRKEGVNINLGLLALGNVINALCMQGGGKPQFISYRDSALTRLLRDSLNGSSFTVMIACISPAIGNITETVNTLRYADRARQIKTKPVISRANNKENLPSRRMLEPPLLPPTPSQWQRTPLGAHVHRRLLPGSARGQNVAAARQLKSTLLGSHAEEDSAAPVENASFMSLSPVRPTLPLTPLVERLYQRLEPKLCDDISKKLDSFMMTHSHLNTTTVAAPEPTLTEEQQSLVDLLDTTLQRRKRKTMDCTPSRGEVATPVTVKRRALTRSGSEARRSGSLGSSPKLEVSSSCQQDDTVVYNVELENRNLPASPDGKVSKSPKGRSPFAVPNPPLSCVANRTRSRTCVFQKRVSPRMDNVSKPRVTRQSTATGPARTKSCDLVYTGSAENTQREHNRNVLEILNTASEKHLQCLARVGPKGARRRRNRGVSGAGRLAATAAPGPQRPHPDQPDGGLGRQVLPEHAQRRPDARGPAPPRHHDQAAAATAATAAAAELAAAARRRGGSARGRLDRGQHRLSTSWHPPQQGALPDSSWSASSRHPRRRGAAAARSASGLPRVGRYPTGHVRPLRQPGVPTHGDGLGPAIGGHRVPLLPAAALLLPAAETAKRLLRVAAGRSQSAPRQPRGTPPQGCGRRRTRARWRSGGVGGGRLRCDALQSDVDHYVNWTARPVI
ncbi:uncharacterized protein LOC144138351 isoform X4 [Haemaphysalis longicornis]